MAGDIDRTKDGIDKWETMYTISNMGDIIYEYSQLKNLKLLEERGVGFEDVIAILNADGPLTILNHPNKKKYGHQKIYVVGIDGYAYLVPFEREGKKATLKTIYPSRKINRLYRDKL